MAAARHREVRGVRLSTVAGSVSTAGVVAGPLALGIGVGHDAAGSSSGRPATS